MSAVPASLHSPWRQLYGGAAALAGVMLISVFLLMIGETIARKFAGSYIPGASQWISWCCAGSAFLAMPYAFRRGDFVRVDLITQSLPAKSRHSVELLALAWMLAFCLFASYAAMRYVWDAYRSDEITQGMVEIPLWWPQMSMVLGLSLLALAVAEQLFERWRAGPTLTVQAP
jgi:TRAP-type C4-dicarboxylate transport system permease small subunit